MELKIKHDEFEHSGWQFEHWSAPIWGAADFAAANNDDLMPGSSAVDKFPDAFFGHNAVRITNGNFAFELNAKGMIACTRLDRPVERPDHFPLAASDCRNLLQAISVPEADSWAATYQAVRDNQPALFQHIQPNYDWSFSSLYWGAATWQGQPVQRAGAEIELLPPSASSASTSATEGQQEITTALPLSLLADRSLPILWACHCPLIEDDLGDSGLASATVRLRVMPSFWLVLCALQVRVDGGVWRSLETRAFHEFGKEEVIREFVFKEASTTELRQRCEANSSDPHARPAFSDLNARDVRLTAVQRLSL